MEVAGGIGIDFVKTDKDRTPKQNTQKRSMGITAYITRPALLKRVKNEFY